MRVLDLGCNVFLLRNTRGRLIVDTGSVLHARTFERLLRAVRPDAVLLTHHHVDHRGGAHIAARHDVPLLAHRHEIPYLTGRLFRMPFPPQAPAVGRALVRLHPRVPPGSAHPVNDGDDLLGHTVLHLPGHTRGQLGLLVHGERTAIVADALVSRDGRAHLPLAAYNDDHPQAQATLQRLAQLDVDRVWCGHGPPVPIEAVRARAQRGSRER